MRKRIQEAIANLRANGTNPRYLVVNCNRYTNDQLACFKLAAREFDLRVQHAASLPHGEMMLTESKP